MNVVGDLVWLRENVSPQVTNHASAKQAVRTGLLASKAANQRQMNSHRIHVHDIGKRLLGVVLKCNNHGNGRSGVMVRLVKNSPYR